MKSISISDIPFSGDFIMKDVTGNILFDSYKDGYDVSPFLCIAPVVALYVKDNRIVFEIKTEWEKGEI